MNDQQRQHAGDQQRYATNGVEAAHSFVHAKWRAKSRLIFNRLGNRHLRSSLYARIPLFRLGPRHPLRPDFYSNAAIIRNLAPHGWLPLKLSVARVVGLGRPATWRGLWRGEVSAIQPHRGARWPQRRRPRESVVVGLMIEV